jgi:hypothetical protein
MACTEILEAQFKVMTLQIEGWSNMPDEKTPAVYCANHESYMVRPVTQSFEQILSITSLVCSSIHLKSDCLMLSIGILVKGFIVHA